MEYPLLISVVEEESTTKNPLHSKYISTGKFIANFRCRSDVTVNIAILFKTLIQLYWGNLFMAQSNQKYIFKQAGIITLVHVNNK